MLILYFEIKTDVLSFGRSPKQQKNLFFFKHTKFLNYIGNKYSNLVAGDTNIKTADFGIVVSNQFLEFRNVFNITKFVKGPAYSQNLKENSIDVLIINQSNGFQKLVIYSISLSDCHLLFFVSHL